MHKCPKGYSCKCKCNKMKRKYANYRKKLAKPASAKRRRYRQRYRYRRRKPAIGAFPSRKNVVLRYVDDFTLNAGNASTAVRVFKVNSLFDPDDSVGGHQPMYFDQYKLIYSGYKVNYATITFICTDNHVVNTATTFNINGTTTSNPQYYALNERACRMFILRDKDNNDFTTALNTLIEEGNRNLKWRFAPQTTAGGMQKLRMRCWPHKQLQLSYNDNDLQAGTGADPTKLCYFICGIDGMPGSNPDSMNFQIIITYHCTFFNPIANQAQN